ncbi:MAG: FAD-binding oxidoreductase [Deltaproteobacteria bacterium]|nr:FAD-binding oxidoreductase [Deltaproteobacteria bacterium]
MGEGARDMPKTEKLVWRLKEIVGESHIIKEPDNLKDYGLDGKRPKVVVFPGTISEVSKVVAYANEQSLTLLPMGNGTKLGMGGIPQKMNVVLSTLRLNRMTDCDCDNLTLSAECGIPLGEAQKRLSQEGKGYFLPLDPPFTKKATLGGIVATNSSGPRRLLYGTARDLIIGTKAVFPNGDIVASGGKTVKNVSGYDMCKLLIGSYGTLGILCEITFKLLPLPERTATLLLPFVRLEEAVQFGREILQSQYLPSSIEILNEMVVKKIKPPIAQQGNYLVAIGLDGVAESIERQVSEIGERAKKKGALEIAVLASETHPSFWKAIQDFSEGLAEEGANFISFKSNFLISRCEEVMGSYEKIARESGVDCGLICHSGNGVLYSYVLAGKGVRSKKESLLNLIKEFSSVAVKNEGHLVVESAPPDIKKRIDVWGEPRGDYEIMRRLKKEIDPKGILNPGRFVGRI